PRARRRARTSSPGEGARSWLTFLGAGLRNRFDRIDDGLVAGAAAVIAGNVFANVLTARHAVALQQILRGEHHAGRAVAALQGVALLERRLQIGGLAR